MTDKELSRELRIPRRSRKLLNSTLVIQFVSQQRSRKATVKESRYSKE